jgi:hypothetical protein
VISSDLYLTGMFNGVVSFDTINLSSSSSQMYLAKFGAEMMTGIKEHTSVFSFSVYPNPSTGCISISCIAEKEKELSLCIRNSIGQLICIEKIKNTSGSFSKQLDVGILPKGIYFVELFSENDLSRDSKKIVIE